MRRAGWLFGVLLSCCVQARAQMPAPIEQRIPGGPAAPGEAPKQAPGSVPSPVVPIGATHHLTPVNVPALSPGVLLLLELEGRFSDEVAAGGGKAFAAWFADDAVTLNNGQPVVRGRGAIEAAAAWDPKQYSLSWVAEGAEMGPSNDMGYTWGRYTGRTAVPGAEPAVSSGRYITIWKKLADGTWKVALDASASLPPDPAAKPAPDATPKATPAPAPKP